MGEIEGKLAKLGWRFSDYAGDNMLFYMPRSAQRLEVVPYPDVDHFWGFVLSEQVGGERISITVYQIAAIPAASARLAKTATAQRPEVTQ